MIIFSIRIYQFKSFFPVKAYYSLVLSVLSPSVVCNTAPEIVLKDGTAPLWMAAQRGHSETVRVLLLRGADRDAERHVKHYL